MKTQYRVWIRLVFLFVLVASGILRQQRFLRVPPLETRLLMQQEGSVLMTAETRAMNTTGTNSSTSFESPTLFTSVTEAKNNRTTKMTAAHPRGSVVMTAKKALRSMNTQTTKNSRSISESTALHGSTTAVANFSTSTEIAAAPPKSSLSIEEKFCASCQILLGGGNKMKCAARAVHLLKRYNLTKRKVVETMLREHPDACIKKQREVVSRVPGVPGVTGNSTKSGKQVTAWCSLGQNNTPPTPWLGGFSHALQALAPCWSYFCRVREQLPDAQCGFWFQPPKDAVFMSHVRKGSSGWVGTLLQAMNCSYHFQASPPLDFSWHYHYKKNYNAFFQRPSDATLLGRAVMGDSYYSGPSIRNGMADHDQHQLRIGLVQRQGQRRNITNLLEIRKQIQVAYPAARIEWGEMEGLSMREQASFWNRQDVIVAAHGAAMTNAMFMRRHAAVVEIFPLHYYVMMYRELCRTIAVNHMAWVDDVEFLELDYAMHAGNRQVRFQLRSTPLTPPVHRIMDLVHQAVQAATGATTS